MVVVGAGVIGSAIAFELARRRIPVVGVDRLPRGGIGSSALSSAVIRCHYTWPEAVRLAHEGLAAWKQWRRTVGFAPRASFHRTGVLFLLPRHGAPGGALGVKAEAAAKDLKALARMMGRQGVRARALDRRALRREFPFFRFDDAVGGLYEPDSGYVDDPAGAVEDLRQAAEARGARFEFNHRVTAIDRIGGRVTAVEVEERQSGRRQELPARAVVNASGPHSGMVNLLAACPLPLTTAPQRQYIVEATFENRAGHSLPCVADLALGFYMRPDRRVFKIGAIWPRDHREFLSDPDAEGDLRSGGRFMEEKLSALVQRYPALQLSNVTVKPAVYDWTVRDSYPILGATEREGYYVAIGTSGAWFKGAPSIGYAMATLIATGRTKVKLPRTGKTLDLRVFGPDR